MLHFTVTLCQKKLFSQYYIFRLKEDYKEKLMDLLKSLYHAVQERNDDRMKKLDVSFC